MSKRHDDRLLLHELAEIGGMLGQVRQFLRHPHQAPTIPDGVEINQIDKEQPMSITGTNAGGQSTFEADALLAGIADPDGFPAGSVDTWTTDDPLATVSPDSGPNESQVVVSGDAADKGTSYNLTVSVQMPTPAGGSAPAALVPTVNVPIIPAPPPVPTGVVINQVS